MKNKIIAITLCVLVCFSSACRLPQKVTDYPSGLEKQTTIETADNVRFNVLDDNGEILSNVDAKVIKDADGIYPICSMKKLTFTPEYMSQIAEKLFDAGSVKVISLKDGRKIGGLEAIQWYYYEFNSNTYNIVDIGYCKIRGLINGIEYELDFGKTMGNETVDLCMTDSNHEVYYCDVGGRNCVNFRKEDERLAANNDISVEVATANKIMDAFGINKDRYEMTAYFDTLILGNGAKAGDYPNATYMYYSERCESSVRPYCALLDQYGYFGNRLTVCTDREWISKIKTGCSDITELTNVDEETFFKDDQWFNLQTKNSWPYETLSIAVEKSGLLREFNWASPMKVSVDSTEVSLLDFDKVTELAQEYIKKYGVLTADIDSVELAMAPAQTEAGFYYMVPAWYFFANKYSEEAYIKNPEAYLVINAIDGSLITYIGTVYWDENGNMVYVEY